MQKSNNSSISSAEIIDVAILTPKIGPEAELGKEYAQMVKMGLADSAKSKIRVTSYDSSTPENLRESLNKIADLGTDIIIGPIYTEPTKIAATKFENQGKIIFSLSNNPSLANQQVFILGHAPMRQLEQLTNHFLDNGYKNYILLLPSNRRATLESKILSEIVDASGGVLDKTEFYGGSEQEIADAVASVSARVDELNENDQNLKQPVILLSDDPATLQILYSNVTKYNLDKKAVIAGDNRINSDPASKTHITFTGALNNTSQKLAARARHHISFMHALAYDAGRIVGENIGSHYNKKAFLDKVNAMQNFEGASGNIHFTDSIAQREYDIIEQQNGKWHKLEKELDKESTSLEHNEEHKQD
jgi:ABC-type branched-subunit amino acid transport system substrate-binding protein